MEILNVLKGWASKKNLDYINFIIAKIMNANIFNIVLHIILNSPQLIKDIADMIK